MMFSRYKRSSLRTKVVIAMTLIIFVYSIIFIIISVRNMKHELYSQIEVTNMEYLNQFNDYIGGLQKDMVNISSLPYTDQSVLDIIAAKEDITLTKNQSRVREFLLRASILNSNINFSGLINEKNLYRGYYIAADNSFDLKEFSELEKSAIFKDFMQSGEIYKCYNLKKGDTSVISQNRNDKILFICILQDPKKSFENIGYMLLGVDLEKFDQLSETFVGDGSGLTIYDKNGDVLYQKGVEYEQVKEADSEKYLICSTEKNEFGWNIVSYKDMTIVPNIWFSNSVAYIILIIVASLCVFVIMAGLLASVLTAPLKKLLCSMKKSQEGDFEQYVPIKYHDEIGELTDGYNKMISRIKELIEQNYTIKLEEKKAELGILQAQINPHFLYNTLDFLYWKAMVSGNQEIAQTVYSLARLFYLALNKGEVWIRIEQEGEFLTHYLSLQKSLMSGRLEFDIKVDETIKEIRIPRFILQPFVENALVHGFEGKDGKCQIVVEIEAKEKDIKITIKDNGCGMPQEKAEKIFSLNETASEQGYAISNVIHRLDMYFKEKFKIEVVSGEGQGTKVILILSDILTEEGESEHV